MADGNHDLEDDDIEPTIPLAVNIAGYCWVVLGCIGFIASLALLIWAIRPDSACAVIVLTSVGMTLGAIFIYAGWTMALGRPRDTWRFGMWSIGFSLFFFGIAAVLLLSLIEFGLAMSQRMFVTVGLFFTIGILFAASGSLAISSRTSYRKWRAYIRPPQPKPVQELDDEVRTHESNGV